MTLSATRQGFKLDGLELFVLLEGFFSVSNITIQWRIQIKMCLAY